MNIAMILEMAADALGDRVAIGSRADGLTYELLRAAARGIADRVGEDTRRRHPGADGAERRRSCPRRCSAPRGRA